MLDTNYLLIYVHLNICLHTKVQQTTAQQAPVFESKFYWSAAMPTNLNKDYDHYPAKSSRLQKLLPRLYGLQS